MGSQSNTWPASYRLQSYLHFKQLTQNMITEK